MDKFNPTTAVLNSTERGKALCKQFNKNLSVISKSATRVKPAEPTKEMTLNQVKELYAYLSSLEDKIDLKKATINGSPDNATLSWFTAGGSAGLAWCRLILKQQGILKSYSKEITKEELNTEDNSRFTKAPVLKALNEELKQVTYVAMQPGVDLHGDQTDAEEIRKAKENFNKSAQRANLFHMVMTDTFEVIESYLAPVDMIINEHFVEKGAWLMTLQVYDDSLWEMIKSGSINGISIGALANVQDVEDEMED